MNRLLIGACLLICLSSRVQSQVDSTFKSLEEARETPTQVAVLDLSRDRIKEWPDSLWIFPNLRHLDLSHNKLKSIAPQVKQLTGLKSLDLTANKIDSVPQAVSHLKALEVLRLGNNEIFHVSEQLAQLSALRVLELWSNNIYYLPASLGSLPLLEEVDLRGIQMSKEHQQAIKSIFEERDEVKLKFSMSCNCY